jgi:hypothetical protein
LSALSAGVASLISVAARTHAAAPTAGGAGGCGGGTSVSFHLL